MPVRTEGIFYKILTVVILERENWFVSGAGRSASSCAYPIFAWLFRNLTRRDGGKREELGKAVSRITDQR